EPAVALRQLRLSLQQLADLGFHKLLVEHLPAGDAVDLCAQRRDTILIGLLQARLTRHRRVDQVVSEDQVGRGEQVADGHCCKRRSPDDNQPWMNLEMADVVAARDNYRVRFFPSAEDRWPTCHWNELPYRHNCDEADYTSLGLTKPLAGV